MILVEAQSTWSVNILIRVLFYIAQTYQEYILKNCGIEVKIKIICSSESGSIIDQYITFTKVYNEQIMKTYVEGERREAARETAKETALRMLQTGKITLDEVSEYFPVLKPEDMKELKEKLNR